MTQWRRCLLFAYFHKNSKVSLLHFLRNCIYSETLVVRFSEKSSFFLFSTRAPLPPSALVLRCRDILRREINFQCSGSTPSEKKQELTGLSLSLSRTLWARVCSAKSLPALTLPLSLLCRCHFWGTAGHPGQQVGVAGLLQPDGTHPWLVLPELPSSRVPVRSREDSSTTHEEGLLHREVEPATTTAASQTTCCRVTVQLKKYSTLTAVHVPVPQSTQT